MFAHQTLINTSGREYGMMTEWERQREREEFTRTAKVFRPFSASLDSRFTREGGGEETEQRPEVKWMIV